MTDELIVVARASSEAEAVSLSGLLESAGIDSIYRVTNVGAGAFDGWAAGAPHEILVHAEDAEVAREVLAPSE
jgi:Putative prokaryotic signal transducing protein